MKPKASPQAGLTEAQVNRLHALLENKRQELLSRAKSTLGRVGGEHESLADPVDRANESQEDAEGLGVADPDHQVLIQIQEALARLQDGTYGLSSETDEPIGFGRLEAVPWATRSAQEQEALEPKRGSSSRTT
jgi:DnaK suppressor protein